jgi:hypothetical protein
VEPPRSTILTEEEGAEAERARALNAARLVVIEKIAREAIAEAHD